MMIAWSRTTSSDDVSGAHSCAYVIHVLHYALGINILCGHRVLMVVSYPPGDSSGRKDLIYIVG